MNSAAASLLNTSSATESAAFAPALIERLTMTSFRCYEAARIETRGHTVVLTGPNGAGKTNVLEAVSLLTPGRGLRRAPFGNLSRRGPEAPGTGSGWAVAATVRGPLGETAIGTGVVAGSEKRTIQIDGRPARSQAALGDYLAAQWLTPAMDRIFVEGRSGRRRFLDRLVYNIDPAHAGRINAYEHAMRERARLLRDEGDPGWIAVLEETMATKGVAVAAARLDLVARLNRYCRDGAGPFPGAELLAKGDVERWLGEVDALEAEDRLRAALHDARRSDADVGGAATGPHRSDFGVTHLPSGQGADLCSTGEQKALLIAIVIASARMSAAECGRLPVLLLDEITAHLDGDRRDGLFNMLRDLGAQSWMTGTDRSFFEALDGEALFVDVANGVLTPDTSAE